MGSIPFFKLVDKNLDSKVLVRGKQCEKVAVIKLSKLGILLLMSFIFWGKAFASTSEFQDSCDRVKKLYDTSKYAECIDESSHMIQSRESAFLRTKNYILLANLHELQADCLERRGDIDQAVEVIQTLLKKLEQLLPREYGARVKLKVGHIYKRAGLYSKALSNFKKVEEEYKSVFPNRFARYARENYDDISSKQVAVISGEVVVEDGSTYEGITIKVFNGFEESETGTLKKGDYSIPLFYSTPNTGFSLSAYKRGYEPFIVTMVFDGSSKIVMKKIQLKKLARKDRAVVAGVIFTPVSGGKRKPHHGIAGFKKHTIEFQKLSENKSGKEAVRGDVISMVSDDSGVYRAPLSAGLYMVKNEGKEKMFNLRRGEVRILNIAKGGILMD